MATPKELRFFEEINRYQSLRFHYSKKFENGRGMTKGEVSPGYGIMSKEQIRFVRRVVPEARLIFIVRDPVDRTWAATRRAFSRPLFQFDDRPGLYIENALNRGRVGHYLRHYFDSKGWGLSDDVFVQSASENVEWLITDPTRNQNYIIRKEDGRTIAHIASDQTRELFSSQEFYDIATLIKSYMTCEHQAKLNDYGAILSNWLDEFPEEQILVVLYDRIRDFPQQVLREIFSHIGVTDQVDWSSFPYAQRINENPRVELPVDFRDFMENAYRCSISDYREIKARCRPIGNHHERKDHACN